VDAEPPLRLAAYPAALRQSSPPRRPVAGLFPPQAPAAPASALGSRRTPRWRQAEVRAAVGPSLHLSAAGSTPPRPSAGRVHPRPPPTLVRARRQQLVEVLAAVRPRR